MVGASIASKMLDSVYGQWQWLMIIASGIAFCFSIIIYLLLNPQPSDVGLKVETHAKPIDEDKSKSKKIGEEQVQPDIQ